MHKSRGAASPAVTVTVAVVVMAAGILLWDGEGASIRTARAIFDETVLDLKLDGQDGISGTISDLNIWPGETARGRINLTVSGTSQATPSLYDLDFDFRHTDVSPANFTDQLIATVLSYGDDDLLVDPGRNLIEEIDENPNLGNSDGRLSLRELEAGANDLALPGPPGNPTPFVLEVTLATETGNFFQGAFAGLIIVFQASDNIHEDLN